LGGVLAVYLRSEWQVFETDLGGFQRIALQDGSIALLNTNSELRVRLTKERRQIELDRGEALFKVAHDTARPFDVRAGDTVVRAVGTQFAVRLRDERQVDVLVKDGRVALNPPDDSLNSQLARPIPMPQPSILTAGEAVRVGAHKLHAEKIDEEDINRKLAWTQGRLWFDRVALAEAVAEINRYNRRQLIIDDPRIAELHIGGTFDATDVDSFVAALGPFGIETVEHRDSRDSPEGEPIRLVGSAKQH
jgi:transmembrane sensor